MTAPPTTRDRRWHDLDALRAFAMLLGIGLHAALSFYPTVWPVQDITADADGLFDEFVLFVHGFRMPLFFLLSGFFAALLWKRRGLPALLGHRLRRVVCPSSWRSSSSCPRWTGCRSGRWRSRSSPMATSTPRCTWVTAAPPRHSWLPARMPTRSTRRAPTHRCSWPPSTAMPTWSSCCWQPEPSPIWRPPTGWPSTQQRSWAARRRQMRCWQRVRAIRVLPTSPGRSSSGGGSAQGRSSWRSTRPGPAPGCRRCTTCGSCGSSSSS